MSLRGRLLTLLLVLMLLGGTSSAAFLWTTLQRDAAHRLLDEHLEPARDALHRLVVAGMDQPITLRDYLVGQDVEALAAYQDAVATKQLAGSELRRLLADEDDLSMLAEHLDEAYQAWRLEVGDRAIALAGTGRLDEASALVAAEDAPHQENIRELGERLRERLLARQADTQESMADAQARFRTLLTALVVIGGTVVGSSWWLLHAWITSPLERLRRGVRSVASGQLHQAVPVLGPPELSQVARDIEAMRRRLAGALGDAVVAREALEQQGAAVVLLRRELAPNGDPLPDDLEIAAEHHPAEGLLAGDWYDCFTLDREHVAVAMVDVSGHGPAAGAFALRVKHYLQAALREDHDPGRALGRVAECVGDTGEQFCTAIVGVVHTRRATLRYASAGHPEGIVAHRGAVRLLAPTGPLLGPFPATWTTGVAALPPGALLCLYTDGVLEARHGESEFGQEQLMQLLRTADGERAGTVVRRCLGVLQDFAPGRFADDLTFLVVRHQG